MPEINEITSLPELKAGIALWNKKHSRFKIRQHLYYQNLLAPYSGVKVRLFGLFRESDKDELDLIGFAACKYPLSQASDFLDTDLGWISLLVTKAQAGSALWRKLLAGVENVLLNIGVRRINYGGDPQNFFSGLPKKFAQEAQAWETAGYKSGEIQADLQRIYTEPPEVEIFSQSGARVKQVELEERSAFLSFLEAEFPGRWEYEAKNISRWPVGLQDYYILTLQSAGIVGFARTNRQDSFYQGPNINWSGNSGEKYAGLGPLGIGRSWWGQGLSTPFLQNVLLSLYNRGYREITIDWTTLVAHYQRFGFQVNQEYIPLQKELNKNL